MLNLLTDPAIAYRRRPYLDCASGRVASRKFFDFPTAEAVMLPGGEDLRIVTTFDGAPLPQLVRMMARLRRVAPPAYARARSLIAQRKANQHGSGNENITLTALAVGSGHQIADYDCLILDSDYGTTAGVAAAAAVAAAQGDLTAGAGHPARFFSLEALLEAPLVTQHVVARRSSAGAPRA
jgi:hypothetical protein